MTVQFQYRVLVGIVGGLVLLLTSEAGLAKKDEGTRAEWLTVVNQNDVMPNTITPTNPAGRNFNSFNQPSVNDRGRVVFRARSRGGPPLGMPSRGIYIRDMSCGDVPASGIQVIADRSSTPTGQVPYPNNLGSGFIEFPSVPRIAIGSEHVATRGNHPPTWEFTLPDDTETRVGTTGVYVSLSSGELLTAAGKLGAVPGFEIFQVPGAAEGTLFDVFPGTPAITDQADVAFKGNYTEIVAGVPVPKTGVFYRHLVESPAGGSAPVELIASSDTVIPNLPSSAAGLTFGSTGPPSAAGEQLVFVGLDVEEAPGFGGIYLTELSQPPLLTPLVEIGEKVPGVRGTVTRLGEALSFDGRFVGFWGAWGTRTRTLWLDCPTEGNQQRIQFCLENVGNDFPVEVPVDQGVFVYDLITSQLRMVARTGEGIDDFLYWNFSGLVPGEEDDGEPARWRSSAFITVAGRPGASFFVVFKARRGEWDATEHRYIDPVDGIYLSKGPGRSPMETLLDTTMSGSVLDPEAPVDTQIAELGLERDGFRGRWLAINARLAVPGAGEEEGLAGIYVSWLPSQGEAWRAFRAPSECRP
jgi:hypothetical protein